MKSFIEYFSQGEKISSIDEYLLSKKNKKANSGSFKLKCWDTYRFNQDIKSEDLAKFVIAALEKSKINPKDIQEEVSQYKDPDDLWDAYDREELYKLKRFETTLSELLFNDSRYSGNEGDICDGVFELAYDIMGEIEKYLKEQ